MKKFLTLLLIMSLILISTTCHLQAAASIDISASKSISVAESKVNQQYGFIYSELEDTSGRVIRSYRAEDQPILTRNSANAVNTATDYLYTKAVLSDLGVKDSSISMLTDSSLKKYASAKSIQSIIAYTKTDANGNTQIISEETALKEIANTRAGNPPLPEDFGDGSGSNDSYFNTYSDEYMFITFLVTEMGDGFFYYTAEATWLTMPFFRADDAFGMCVLASAIPDETRYGWVSYTRYTQTPTSGTQEYLRETFHQPASNYQSIINGSWEGSAMVFNLPNDIYPISVNPLPNSLLLPIVYYEDYTAHYEFDASVIEPDETVRFKATASYVHQTVAIDITPTIEISTSGSSASIGLALIGDTDTRTVSLPSLIIYEPED